MTSSQTLWYDPSQVFGRVWINSLPENTFFTWPPHSWECKHFLKIGFPFTTLMSFTPNLLARIWSALVLISSGDFRQSHKIKHHLTGISNFTVSKTKANHSCSPEPANLFFAQPHSLQWVPTPSFQLLRAKTLSRHPWLLPFSYVPHQSISKSCWLHLQNTSITWPPLTTCSTTILFQVTLTSCLDDCTF